MFRVLVIGLEPKLSRALEGKGLQVQVAPDHAAALPLLNASLDVVVLNAAPSTLAAFGQLRELSHEVPVVVTLGPLDEARKAGAWDVVESPTPERLRFVFQNSAEVSRLRREVRALRPNARPFDPEETLPETPPEPARSTSRYRTDRTLREQLTTFERELVEAALRHTGENVAEAARLLGLERGHFYKKLKALGVTRPAS